MKKIVLSLSALALIVASCKKEEVQPIVEKTKTELLTSSGWKIDKYEYDNDQNGSIDETYGADSCEVDDVISFKTDKTLTINSGTIKCGDNGSSSVWSFYNSDNGIILDGDSAKVETLNGSTFRIEFIDKGVGTGEFLQLKH